MRGTLLGMTNIAFSLAPTVTLVRCLMMRSSMTRPPWTSPMRSTLGPRGLRHRPHHGGHLTGTTLRLRTYVRPLIHSDAPPFASLSTQPWRRLLTRRRIDSECSRSTFRFPKFRSLREYMNRHRPGSRTRASPRAPEEPLRIHFDDSRKRLQPVDELVRQRQALPHQRSRFQMHGDAEGSAAQSYDDRVDRVGNGRINVNLICGERVPHDECREQKAGARRDASAHARNAGPALGVVVEIAQLFVDERRLFGVEGEDQLALPPGCRLGLDFARIAGHTAGSAETAVSRTPASSAVASAAKVNRRVLATTHDATTTIARIVNSILALIAQAAPRASERIVLYCFLNPIEERLAELSQRELRQNGADVN